MKIFFLLLQLITSAHAASFKAVYWKVPTSISGTLTPFVVAIDGETVTEGTKNLDSLVINGVTFAVKNKDHGPFFLKTESDELVFSDLPTVKLPIIEEVTVQEAKVTIQTSKNVTDIFFDSKPLKRNRDKKFSAISSKPGFFEAVHVVELRTKDRFAMRIYNLSFEKAEEPPPPPPQEKEPEPKKPEPPPVPLKNDPYANLSFTPFDKDRQYFHFGIGSNWKSRISTSTYLETAVPRYNDWYHWAVGFRMGYQIFSWLELGLSTRVVIRHANRWEIESHYTNSYSQPINRQSGIQAGPYVKIEPLRLGFFGLGITMEADGIINTLTNGGASIGLVESYFHF